MFYLYTPLTFLRKGKNIISKINNTANKRKNRME